MPNLQQNNEIGKKSESISKWVNANRKNTSKKRTNLSQTKKIQNIVKNIFQNKIEQIKKNTNLLQNILAHVKKRKRLFEKGLKKIAKM